MFPNSEVESCDALTTESIISQNPEPSGQSSGGESQSSGLNDSTDEWADVRRHPLVVRAKEFERKNEETPKEVNDTGRRK